VPTYEYSCQSCGHHIEVYQRFSDESLTECGVCGGPLRKVFHPAGILFKGSGFYATDSRGAASKDRAERAGTGTSSSSSEGSDSGSASASKPSQEGSAASGSSSAKERPA
jgi:putative FmdB family regulatory protein